MGKLVNSERPAKLSFLEGKHPRSHPPDIKQILIVEGRNLLGPRVGTTSKNTQVYCMCLTYVVPVATEKNIFALGKFMDA